MRFAKFFMIVPNDQANESPVLADVVGAVPGWVCRDY